MTELRRRLQQDLRIRNYSPATVERYVEAVAGIAKYYKLSPERLSPEQIRGYLVYLVEERQRSFSLLKQVVCALRFLFTKTLKLPASFSLDNLPQPRKIRRLPIVLSVGEVGALIGATLNLKHRALLATAYGTGVRVSELARLRVTDIDSARMVVHVRCGKGQVDRDLPLSPGLLELLRTYWAKYRPREWLFPGQDPSKPIVRESIQKVCGKARGAAGLAKRATPHSMRHAFATHLIERGVNIRVVQFLLGHRSLRTTQIYTHVTTAMLAKVPPLFDLLPPLPDLPADPSSPR